jgi:hypothetical protein
MRQECKYERRTVRYLKVYVLSGIFVLALLHFIGCLMGYDFP